PEKEAVAFWTVDNEVFRTGRTITNEEYLTDAAGSTHFISTKKSRFVGKDGRRYLVGVIRDITEQHEIREKLSRRREHLEELVKERTLALSSTSRMLQIESDERMRVEAEKREMQEQIIHQQKLEAIGRFAGGIAHDFNNLLALVFGHVALALRDGKMDQKTRESLLLVREAAIRSTNYTKQLLAFSRKQDIEPSVVDINVLIGDIQRLLDRIIGEDVTLVTRCEKQLGRIHADPVQVEQVIVNLVVNARDAMPQGGILRIETASCHVAETVTEGPPPGNYAVLVVADTGVGMDKDVQARVFEPFFTTKKNRQGTGLGLSTVSGIVKQHGGTIIVNSAPNQGATFRVYWPCVDSPVESVRENPSGKPMDCGDGLPGGELASEESEQLANRQPDRA
ncbi:MAG: ATP-binding protein, partial [Polyangiaceae bacterium]|nr:ATP-binding protein [Polyangiaceae bacterium]